MPINYSQYHPHWHFISWLIRFKRANNKCEWCGVPNYSFIKRHRNHKNAWRYAFSIDELKDFKEENWTNREIAKEFDCTYVVLTVAHIDHNKTYNHFSNLAALCQRCHLKHDINQHNNNRKYGRDYKLSQTTLDLKTL